MITLTLLVKANNSNQLRQVKEALNVPFGELSVKVKIIGTVADRWVRISLEGEDEKIAATYITNEIGVCPISIEKIEKTTDLKGYITDFEKKAEELLVDIGVFEPKITQARISPSYLRVHLVDERKIAPKRIAELYGLCRDLPINVNVVRVDGNENRIEAELSDKQLKTFQTWKGSLLDRLLILGASLENIENVLESERLNRDVIGVEPLGLLEYSLTCKLGTDAAGLIPRIGRKLREARFSVFNPEKLLSLELLNN